MIKRSPSEWREIRAKALDAKYNALGSAIEDEFKARSNSLLTELDNVKTPSERLKYIQGSRAALKSAIIILDDLIRMADRGTEKQES